MRESEASFAAALYEIGRLTYSWTNTESLLVHVMAGLIGTDKEKALLIFLTLNTTRARVDLVERLAKAAGPEDGRQAVILALTKRLSKLSGERNHYLHAIYAFDAEKGDVSTIQMRISDRDTGLKMGRRHPLDHQAVLGLQEVVAQLAQLNRDLWAAISGFGYPV